MSTHATIYFLNEEFSVSHDGYPQSILPLLDEIKKKAQEYAEQHQMSFDEALWIQLHKHVSDGQLSNGAYSNGYLYCITNAGVIKMENELGELVDIESCLN